MTDIVDVFFGGAEKKAAEVTERSIREAQAITKKGVKQARGDVNTLFPASQQNLQQGFQGALDVFGQTVPQQGQAFQQGNMNAQNTLLSGAPQYQNAILGGNVDYSQLQARQLTPDYGFAQQQLPEYQDPFQAERDAEQAEQTRQQEQNTQSNINQRFNRLGGRSGNMR